MAVITQVNATDGLIAVNLTRAALSASDTLTYQKGAGQKLFLFNTTASGVAITFTGSAPETLNVPGYGTLSTSGGKAITVPASGSTLVELDDISAYLAGNGTVTVTNGTGVTAHLYI